MEKNLDKLDLRAEKSANNTYAAITILIDVVTKQLRVDIVDMEEL